MLGRFVKRGSGFLNCNSSEWRFQWRWLANLRCKRPQNLGKFRLLFLCYLVSFLCRNFPCILLGETRSFVHSKRPLLKQGSSKKVSSIASVQCKESREQICQQLRLRVSYVLYWFFVLTLCCYGWIALVISEIFRFLGSHTSILVLAFFTVQSTVSSLPGLDVWALDGIVVMQTARLRV